MTRQSILDTQELLVTVAPMRFTLDDAQHAADAWGCNCGPGAFAAVLGLTLDEARQHLRGFDAKGYTNPTMMRDGLRSAGVAFEKVDTVWPFGVGLVRVQWEGPWTEPHVPIRARYRHTHWIGARQCGENIWNQEIFDINCMCVGGWVLLREWVDSVVPWLMKECEPKSYIGRWHQTHVLRLISP